MEFHGTKSAPISMEFHGILGAPISLTRAVPWNSIELGVRPFRWLEQFQGIPWNSMELRMCQFRWHEQFHGIPWNSMELGVRRFRWQEQFHGIPWDFGCANFPDRSSSMEFHGTWSAPISLTWEVPWNSMKFRGTWSAPISLTGNSIDFVLRQFRWHEQLHGIPWNLECANFADTSSSMEFHGIPWN